jgi:hypothetical protein
METAMNALSRESRALLTAARQSERLSAADKDRIRGKLSRRIGAGLALGSAVTASATVAEAAHTTALATVAAWLPGVAKVVGIVAIAGGATVGVVRVSQPVSHPVLEAASSLPSLPRATPASLEKATAVIARELPAPVASAAPAIDAQNAAPSGEATPAPVRAVSAPAKHDSLGSDTSPAVAVAAPADDGLTNQVAAIREARAAIRRGDGRAALTAIDRGMPGGQAGPLEQEAVSARVAALCLLGDIAAARRTAEQFLVRFPASPLASGIRNSCAFSSTTSR